MKGVAKNVAPFLFYYISLYVLNGYKIIELIVY